jgi:hypothetical protein
MIVLAVVMIMAVLVFVIVTILVIVPAGLAFSVIMVVMVSVIVTMMAVIMTTVAVIVMVMGMRLMLVGPAFRLEWALDLHHLGAQPLEHVGDHVILADAQPFRPDLGLQVPVAEMPGKPHLMQGIAPLHLEQGLGLGHDLDKAAILQLIGIAMRQSGRLGQVDQNLQPADGADDATPAPAILEGQHDTVDDGLGVDLGGGDEGMSVEHGGSWERGRPCDTQESVGRSVLPILHTWRFQEAPSRVRSQR